MVLSCSAAGITSLSHIRPSPGLCWGDTKAWSLSLDYLWAFPALCFPEPWKTEENHSVGCSAGFLTPPKALLAFTSALMVGAGSAQAQPPSGPDRNKKSVIALLINFKKLLPCQSKEIKSCGVRRTWKEHARRRVINILKLKIERSFVIFKIQARPRWDLQPHPHTKSWTQILDLLKPKIFPLSVVDLLFCFRP